VFSEITMSKELAFRRFVCALIGTGWLLHGCGGSPASTPVPTAAATPTAVLAPELPPQPPRVIGYFTSWGVASRGYTVARIPVDKLTHINYAFSAVNFFGKCALGDPNADTQRFYSARDSVDNAPDVKDGPHGTFNQLLKLKLRHPDLKVLISIGGWNGSGMFSDVALTEESRRTFAQSCVELYLVKHAGVFDGLDIDWEYPVSGGARDGRPEDKRNFTLLLAELRSQLDLQEGTDGREYLLTIAAPAGPRMLGNLELDQIAQYLDWITLMTYDFHGAWDDVTGLHSPLYAASGDPSRDPVVRERYNTDAAVQAYLQAGVSASQLVVGIPFYGRGWKGVLDENRGLFQPADGPARGTWEPGAFDYADLARNYLPTYGRHWHDEAKVPWLHSPDTGVMITYEDPESVGIKADYVRANALGGVMFWELSNDGGVLLDAIHDRLYR
jgi:chitinase